MFRFFRLAELFFLSRCVGRDTLLGVDFRYSDTNFFFLLFSLIAMAVERRATRTILLAIHDGEYCLSMEMDEILNDGFFFLSRCVEFRKKVLFCAEA